jgi:hypothetical protein
MNPSRRGLIDKVKFSEMIADESVLLRYLREVCSQKEFMRRLNA